MSENGHFGCCFPIGNDMKMKKMKKTKRKLVKPIIECLILTEFILTKIFEFKRIKYFLFKLLNPTKKLTWLRRLVCLLKPRLHIEHLNGHDPLCTYMWLFRSPGVGTMCIQVEKKTKTKKNQLDHQIYSNQSNECLRQTKESKKNEKKFVLIRWMMMITYMTWSIIDMHAV